MPHNVTLITTIAAALGAALLFGFIAARLRIPALVGYLIAGVVIGPATPGFVADLAITQQLAELGVMLLMFGVGLHFSFEDLMAVRRIAVPGAVAQMAIATALGVALGVAWGWGTGAGIVFGLALSVASTVVLLRALEGRGLLASINGHIATGWLVVEDLAMVLVLVLLPPLASALGGRGSTGEMGMLVLTVMRTLAAVGIFVALMLIGGRRLFPWLLWQVARTGSRELFTLCVIAAAVGIAYASSVLFGVSYALGAFFAGTVLRESDLSHRAADESLPFRDAFAVLFFVSVGMLFEPSMLWREPLRVLTVVAVIVVGKSLVAMAIVVIFRYPLNTALTVSAGLAQIGEFSFILAALGVSLGVLPAEGQSLLVAGALLSIAINPLVFSAIEPIQAWVRTRSDAARLLEQSDDPLAQLPATFDARQLTGHVVLVGFGRIGRRIGEALMARGIRIVVAEQNRDLVEALRARGIGAVCGDASVPAVLIQAHIVRARALVLAVPDVVHAREMLVVARTLNPGVYCVVRSHGDDESNLLRQERADRVLNADEELAAAMTRDILERIQPVAEAGRTPNAPIMPPNVEHA